jgi:ABC-type antimicrobial peptide transport system permease subunit
MATQIKTAEFIEGGGNYGALPNIEESYFKTLINRDIQFNVGGDLIEYRIRGIYKTNFQSYFEFDTAATLTPMDGVLPFACEGAKFNAPSQLGLKESLTERQIRQVEYLIQHDFVTGYVSTEMLKSVRTGAEGLNNKDGEFLIGNTNSGVANSAAEGYFLTQNNLGLPTGKIFEEIFEEDNGGLLVLSGGAIRGNARVSEEFFTTFFPGNAALSAPMGFNIGKEWTSISPLLGLFGTYSQGFNRVHRIEPLTMERATMSDPRTDFIIQLHNDDYRELFNAIVMPSTSMIVSGGYGARSVNRIINNLGGDVRLSYADSATIALFIDNAAATGTVLTFASVALAMLSAFIMFGFISTRVRKKRKTVAIIRGMGARTRDIVLIFLFEALLVAFGVIFGAWAVTIIATNVGNMLVSLSAGYNLVLFSMSALFYGVFLAGVGVVILGSYLVPAFIYSRRSDKGIVAEIKEGTE